MKKMQIKTGRQAERTAKELKQLRKLEIPIVKPPKKPSNKRPFLENPQVVLFSKNVISDKGRKEIDIAHKQFKHRRQKDGSKKQAKELGEQTHAGSWYENLISGLFRKGGKREITVALHTVQNIFLILMFVVFVIALCMVTMFKDNGGRILELIAGDHQHSEASRVVVDTEKKASP